MFLEVGVDCYYVTEYMDRPARKCGILGHLPQDRSNSDVYVVLVREGEDGALGKQFFAEVSRGQDLRDPENIIPVRIYVKDGAWLSGNPKFGVDVVENGFLCTKRGLADYFPSLAS